MKCFPHLYLSRTASTRPATFLVAKFHRQHLAKTPSHHFPFRFSPYAPEKKGEEAKKFSSRSGNCTSRRFPVGALTGWKRGGGEGQDKLLLTHDDLLSNILFLFRCCEFGLQCILTK